MSRAARLALFDFDDSELSVKAQADLLHVNRFSLYYKPRLPSAEELAIKRRIDES